MTSLLRSLAKRPFVRFTSSKCSKMPDVVEKPHPKGKRLKELQKKFSIDDGVPVYLKGGTKDKIMFQASVAGIAVGLLYSIHTLVHLIVPGWNPPPEVAGMLEEYDED